MMASSEISEISIQMNLSSSYSKISRLRNASDTKSSLKTWDGTVRAGPQPRDLAKSFPVPRPVPRRRIKMMSGEGMLKRSD